MNMMVIIPIIFLIIMFVFFIIYLILSKRQENTLKTIDDSGKIKEDNNENVNNKTNIEKSTKETSTTSTAKSEYKKEDVYKLMEFDRILDDMIVQKGGSRFTMAIQCKGINYDLMSEVEQLSVEEGFITFLNTLKYPIQLYVQAQNIDLKSAIDKYRVNVAPLKEKYEEINNKYTKVVSAFDADETEVQSVTKERDSISNVYEYAADIIKYVEKMSVNKNLLQRKFFVLVSYNTSEIIAIDKFSKEEVVEMCSTELVTRCRAIISALSSCSVSGKILTSNELADLLYSAYNRDDKGIMSVKEAIDSGFFRLYSTSEDAFTRKQEALEEYIKGEAKIRALKAMKHVIENGTLETQASETLEQEEEISRRATNMVKNSGYEPEFENAVSKKILTDFRETKKILSEADASEKEMIKQQYEEEAKKMENVTLEKPEGIKLIEKSKEYARANNSENISLDEKNEENNKVEINENKVEESNEVKENPIANTNVYDDNEEDESIV